MKINKSKFVIGALLSLVSVSIAGSVVGTAAWYTYNTKDSITYSGIASGKSENLQIKLAGEDASKYRADIELSEILKYSKDAGYAESNLEPVSLNKAQESNKSLAGSFIDKPSYLEPNNNVADKTHYFSASFDLRVTDPANPGTYLAKDVYISYLKLTARTDSPANDDSSSSTPAATKDVSDAVRMQLNSGTNNALIAPGITSSGATTIGGYLDLNADGKDDEGWLQQDGTYSPFKGDSTANAKEKVKYGTYTDDTKTTAATEAYFGTNDVITTFADGKISGAAKTLVCTTKTDGSGVRVNLIIWLEGWAPSMIDSNAGATFDLDMLFQIENL